MVIGQPPKLGSNPPSDSFGRHGLSCGREGGRRRWEGGRCPTHRLHLRYQRLGNANTIILCQSNTKPNKMFGHLSSSCRPTQRSVYKYNSKSNLLFFDLGPLHVNRKPNQCLDTNQADGRTGPTNHLHLQPLVLELS